MAKEILGALSHRERDTILAALRCWQNLMGRINEPFLSFKPMFEEIASGHGERLTSSEISELCAKLNLK